MPKLVVHLATLKCPMGDAPGTLTVVRPPVTGVNQPVATVQDFVPMTNIPTFGTCKILTASASGTPTPCVPATTAPSAKLNIDGVPVLLDFAKCICTVGGVVIVQDPGQSTIEVSG